MRGTHADLAARMSGTWAELTLASANWTLTRPIEWRLEAGRVHLRGSVTRTTSTFAASSNLFTAAANPSIPFPAQLTVKFTGAETSSGVLGLMGWVIDPGTGLFRSSGSAPTINVGGVAHMDDISWSLG